MNSAYETYIAGIKNRTHTHNIDFSNDDLETVEVKDPYHIDKNELEETFSIKTSEIIDNLYNSIKQKCDTNSNGILCNPEYSSNFDFHHLIMNNVNLHKFYKKHND